MKKAIVTGANGFVGSHVCKELCSRGVKVYAVIKDSDENIDNIKELENLKVVYCDLDNIASLPEKITDRDIDVFYHFAWVGVSYALRGDVSIQTKNAMWTVQALRIADEMKCKKFVNAGSIMEKETYMAVCAQGSEPGAAYVYGAAKLYAKTICKPVASSLDIDLCWAVITNTYGVGEFSSRFINTTIRKIIAGEPLRFTAANQNYDFIYIDDVARAFVAIGEYGKPNKEYTIGSGYAKPLKEYIIELLHTLAPDAVPLFGDVPFTGVNIPLECFDTTDIETDCRFKPTISFAEGIKLTTDWLKSLNH